MAALAPPATDATIRPLSPGCITADGTNFPVISSRRPSISVKPAEDATRPIRSVQNTSPLVGSYIAFALDIHAIARDHPAAAASVRAFVPKRYAGLVVQAAHHITDDGEEVQELLVNYVTPAAGVGVSESQKEKALPIGGTAPGALNTREFFPWTGCSQLLTRGTRLVIVQEGRLRESALDFELDQDDWVRFDEAMERALVEGAAAGEPSGGACYPDELYPAEVWRDIRVADHLLRPEIFEEELRALELLLQESARSDVDSLA